MKTKDNDRHMPENNGTQAKSKQAANGVPHNRAAAASVIIGMSLTAMAAGYHNHAISPLQTTSLPVASTPDSISHATQDSAYFVFDNVEMKTIAQTLGDYYGLEPLFKDKNAQHVRLYATIEKSASIDEVVALLNNFKKIKLTVRDDRLIIESNRKAVR